MKTIATFAVGLALVDMLSAAPAQAQAVRTFVSPTGVDTAACTLTAPCRTFAAAYAATNAGGEISVLGTAGYGTLTISKAISIVNGGGFEAGVAVPSGDVGITINAGTSDAVSLRGLTIDGAGDGATGIQFNSGKSLTIENCVIRHLTGDGVDFYGNGQNPSEINNRSNLLVSNTLVADNNGNGITAAIGTQGLVMITAVFNHVEASNNGGDGINVNTNMAIGGFGLNATVAESVASNNGGVGFHVAQNESTATLMVFHSVTANNGTGLQTDNNASLSIAQSMVTENTKGWLGNGTVSYGDNYIDHNSGSQGAPPSAARK